MSDPLRDIRAGEPLFGPDSPLQSAATWNAIFEATRAYRRQGSADRRAREGETLRSETRILVENTSGVDQSRFATLALDDPLFDPAEHEDEFAERPAAKAVVADHAAGHRGKFCVLDEPLADGEVGRAYVAGVFPAKLTVEENQDDLDRCDVRDGANVLELTPQGAARVLWREAGEGTVWALIQVGGTGDAVIEGVLDGALVKQGTATLSVYGSEGDTGRNVTVTDKAGFSAPAGTRLLADWIAGRWQPRVHALISTGTASTTIAQGETGTITLPDSSTVTAEAVFAAITVYDGEETADVLVWWSRHAGKYQATRLFSSSDEGSGSGSGSEEQTDTLTVVSAIYCNECGSEVEASGSCDCGLCSITVCSHTLTIPKSLGITIGDLRCGICGPEGSGSEGSGSEGVYPRVWVTALDADGFEVGHSGSVPEAGPAVAFRFHLDQPLAVGVTIRFTVSGDAAPGVDYDTLPGEIIIPPGDSVRDLALVPKDDSAVEGPELVTVTIDEWPEAYWIADPPQNAATHTIIDDDSSAGSGSEGSGSGSGSGSGGGDPPTLVCASPDIYDDFTGGTNGDIESQTTLSGYTYTATWDGGGAG